jgi:hypothetical protein
MMVKVKYEEKKMKMNCVNELIQNKCILFINVHCLFKPPFLLSVY